MFNNNELMEHNDRLQKFAYKLTRNKADGEDLLQSSLLRAIEKKHLFQEGTNLFSWSSKIMYNMFVSNYRRKVKFESQYDPESYIENESVEANQNIKMEFKDVDRAMDELSPEHREIIMMVCVKGMQYTEVAENLDVPVGTVRSRLSRARDNLQNLLDAPLNSNSAPHKIPTYNNEVIRAAA